MQKTHSAFKIISFYELKLIVLIFNEVMKQI